MSPVPDLFFLSELHVTVHHGNETADVSKYRGRAIVLSAVFLDCRYTL